MQCPGCQHDNPAQAKFCLECGEALSGAVEASSEKLEVPRSEGERKLVTVLFSDLGGYTAMSERLDPEEVREIMGRVFGHARPPYAPPEIDSVLLEFQSNTTGNANAILPSSERTTNHCQDI